MTSLPTEKTVTCSKCGETKNASLFTPQPNSTNKSGYHSWCKSCMNDHVKSRNLRRREELGDEAYLKERRDYARTWRTTETGKASVQLEGRVRSVANSRLIANHAREWEHLLSVVRYELTKETT